MPCSIPFESSVLYINLPIYKTDIEEIEMTELLQQSFN